MGSKLSEYINLFSSFTNPVAILLSAIYWTIGTFLFFLLLVIFLRKYILVQRKNKFLKVLSWIYVFVMPVVAAFFGFKFGLLNGIRCDLKSHAVNYTKGIDYVMKESLGKTADEFFVELIAEETASNAELSSDEVIERLSNSVTVEFQKSITLLAAEKETVSGKAASLLLYIINRKGVAMGIRYSVRQLLNRELGINKSTSRELMQIQFKELLQKGIFTQLLKAEIDYLFIPWLKGTALLFLVILLGPVIEIIIANRMHRKEMKIVMRNKFQSAGV